MKLTTIRTLAFAFLLALLCASCVSTSTTYPDGRIVKETKPDAESVKAFTDLAGAFAPKAVLVEDNSTETVINATK